MSSPLKRALLILLLAAVPIQGYAAAGIGICRALAHGGDATAAGHAHYGDAQANAADHAANGSPEKSSTQSAHQCAACASCGVAAAIAAPIGIHLAEAPDRGVAVFAPLAPAGHVPEGVDRPPLTLLV